MPNNYSQSHQSDKRNHSYAQKNRSNSKQLDHNRERKARHDKKNLPGQNKFEDWQQKASREKEKQEKPSLIVDAESFLQKVIKKEIIEKQKAEKIAQQNQPPIKAKENQKNKHRIERKNILQDESRSGLPRNLSRSYRVPTRSPQINPYLATALIVMALVGIVAGVPNTNSSGNNGRDKKSKPFVGDFSDSQGKPIVNSKAPLLPKLIDMPAKDSVPVFQSVSEPTHLMDCARLILNAKALAPNSSSQKDVAKVREIKCVRLREPSDAEAINFAAQEADKAWDSGDHSFREEIISSFAARESLQVAYGGRIKEKPQVKGYLDELTSEKSLPESCGVDYDIQLEAQRVDVIFSGSKEITPTYKSKSLNDVEFSINYNHNDPLLRELQYNLVVACDNLALDQIALLVNRGVKVPSISYVGNGPISLLNLFAPSNTDEAIKAAEILLAQEGVSPDGVSSYDFPLGLASVWGNTRLVRLLLANNANPYGKMPNNAGKFSGKTALDLAFEFENEELIKILLVENNLFPFDQLTIKQIEYLREKQILNFWNLEKLKIALEGQEQIVLELERFNEDREMMKKMSQETQKQLTNNEQEQKLLRYRDKIKNIIAAYVNGVDENDCPLHKAALQGNVEYMKLLIEHGADPHREISRGSDLKRGYNLLDAAFESREVPPLKFLIENQYFSLNSEKGNLITSLLMTKGQITVEQLDYLIKTKSVDINKMYGDHHILCVTVLAGYNNATRAILTLENHLVNIPSKDKMYPLHLAIGAFGLADEKFMSVNKSQEYNQRYESVLLLMNAGADLFATDNDGRTAKDAAEEMDLHEIAALLENAMKEDPRYPEYLAQSVDKKPFKNLLKNNWSQAVLAVLVLIIGWGLHILNIVFPLREAARAQVERERNANAERDEARLRVQTQKERKARDEAEAQARVQAEEKIRLHREELERKRVEDAEAQRKVELQNKLNTISEAKTALDKQVEDFKKRKADFKLKADSRELFPQGLVALINVLINNRLQGEQYRLADKINIKKNEIDAELKLFENYLTNYDLNIKTYDEKNEICQKELILKNVEALKAVQLELEDIVKKLQELEKNINIEKSRAELLIKTFAQVRQQEPAPPAVAVVSGKDKERRFRFNSKAEKNQEPKPKDPSSSKSTAKEEEKAKVLKPAAPIAAQPKNEVLYRKPAAAGAPSRSRAEPKHEKAPQYKPVVQPLAPIAALAKDFPPTSVKLPVLPVQPVASQPAPKFESTPTTTLAISFPPPLTERQATPLEVIQSIPTTSTDADLVLAEENSPRLKP